ncbi:SH3 and PX domain-containing protein 2A [Lamellibrachia satsuma]|nr:SH3 and PX domain-containing protein 2A [Lamellibrachia satsuma]
MDWKQVIDVTLKDVEKRRQPTKHYVYVIRVQWSDNTVNVIYRRYSKFFELQSILLDKFPVEGGERNAKSRTIPYLPGKIIFGRSSILDVALRRMPLIDIYCKKLIKLQAPISRNEAVLKFFEPTPEDLLPSPVPITQHKPVEAPDISEPRLPESCRVIAAYKAVEANETSLMEGMVVRVLCKTPTGWWYVTTSEGEGWVPSCYLHPPDGTNESKVVNTSLAEGRKFVCVQSYSPQRSDEVELDKGTLVTVLERNLDGWWLVRSKGKCGRGPAACLRRTDTLKALRLNGHYSPLTHWPGT